jgi:hypothetical protein
MGKRYLEEDERSESDRERAERATKTLYNLL